MWSKILKALGGGSNKVTYCLTVSCLEHLVARKEHKNVLADIRNIIAQMDEISRLNFQPSTYTSDRGKEKTSGGSEWEYV